MNEVEDKLFGDNSSKKHSSMTFVVFALFIFAVSWAGYFAYYNYEHYFDKNKKTFKQDESELRKKRIKELLLSRRSNISDEQLANGFWYSYTDSYGVEHFAFFDINKLSELNLTQFQINEIINRIKNSKIEDKRRYKILSDDELPDEYRFHNHIYSSPLESNYLNIKYTLENRVKSGKYKKEDLSRLAYLYDLEGLFDKRNELYSLLCKKYGERCKSDLVKLNVTGRVIDINSKPIEGVKIKNLSTQDTDTTDKDGKFSLNISADKLEKLRILASKPGYSDGAGSLIILTKKRKTYDIGDIILSPITGSTITVDTRSQKVLSGDARIKDGKILIKTDKVFYYIPVESIRDAKKRPYKGVVKIQTMYYTRDNAPGSLMNTDMFDSALGYSGNRMYTFGMPYIKFFTESGDELFIYKDKPIVLRYKMLHLDELFERNVINKAQLQAMITASQESDSYPINRRYIKEHDLWGMSTFWVFERNRGVWEEVGKKILDTSGLSEAIFYHLSN